MILLKIRCGRCRRVLKEIAERPKSWDGELSVLRCRCDLPSVERIVDVLMKKQIDGMGMVARVPWSMLREPIERAQKRGKPVDFAITVSDSPSDTI